MWDDGASVRGARFTPSGTLLDAGPGFVIGSGDTPSADFDGTSFVAAYRQLTSAGYQMFANRISPAGTLVDTTPIVLSATPFPKYYSRSTQGPAVAFDGTDSLVVWPSDIFTVQAAWLTPAGAVLSQGTLLTSKTSVIYTPTVAGQGDGDHTLLAYVFGDPAPGVEALRIEANLITARALGHACATDAECKTGNCENGVCAAAATGTGGSGTGGSGATTTGSGGSSTGTSGTTTSSTGTSGTTTTTSSTGTSSSASGSTSGASGAGTSSGSGSGVGGASGVGSGGSSSGTSSPEANGGCGCRTAGADAPAREAALLPLLFGGLLARRRRARRR